MYLGKARRWGNAPDQEILGVLPFNSSPDKLLLGASLLPRLWEFAQRTLLDPSGVYLYINPPQPAIPVLTPSKKGSGRGTPVRRDTEAASPRVKADEDEENEQDRKARLRIGAFGATEWVLSGCPTFLVECMYSMKSLLPLPLPPSPSRAFFSSDAKYAIPSKAEEKAKATTVERHEEEKSAEEVFLGPLANPALWSSLYCGKAPPFVETESFGFEQPVVRRSAWSLLQTCKSKWDRKGTT